MVMALEFCTSLAVHVIAANPLSHASLLPSGSKAVNALCEEALKQQGTWLVVEGCWFWKSAECKICTCQMAGDGGLCSFPHLHRQQGGKLHSWSSLKVWLSCLGGYREGSGLVPSVTCKQYYRALTPNVSAIKQIFWHQER